VGTTNRKRRKTNHKLTQLRGLAEDEPEESQVDSIKRTCVRRKVAEELAEAIGSWWEVCGRGNRKEDWNVPLHLPPLLRLLRLEVDGLEWNCGKSGGSDLPRCSGILLVELFKVPVRVYVPR